MCQGVVLEDYDPSCSPVSYDVMYLPFPYIYGAMFGWDVPLQVDPLLLAMFLFYSLATHVEENKYIPKGWQPSPPTPSAELAPIAPPNLPQH